MTNRQPPPSLADALAAIVRASDAHVEAIARADLPAVVETARALEVAQLEGLVALTPPARCAGSEVFTPDGGLAPCPACGQEVAAFRDSSVTAVAVANGAWPYRLTEHLA